MVRARLQPLVLKPGGQSRCTKFGGVTTAQDPQLPRDEGGGGGGACYPSKAQTRVPVAHAWPQAKKPRQGAVRGPSGGPFGVGMGWTVSLSDFSGSWAHVSSGNRVDTHLSPSGRLGSGAGYGGHRGPRCSGCRGRGTDRPDRDLEAVGWPRSTRGGRLRLGAPGTYCAFGEARACGHTCT